MKTHTPARWLFPLALVLAFAPAAYAGNGVLDQIQGAFQGPLERPERAVKGLVRPAARQGEDTAP